MPTTPIGSPTTPFTSSCSGATPSTATRSPRNPRSRASKIRSGRRRSMQWAANWPHTSSTAIGSGCMGGLGTSRSISIRPMTPPTARSNSPSSTDTTTPGAICRCWRSSPSTTKPSSTCVRRSSGRATHRRRAEPTMGEARTQSEASGQTEHVYTEARYAARTWPHERRIVIKAEVVRLPGREPRDNPRFVITNLRQTPRFVYERVYCARGDIENRIKELHDGLQIGRTSCGRFWANQLRVLLTAAAYVLMQELRLRAARTACAHAQVTTLRERLLKLGVHVVASVRRIVLHLPTSTPFFDAWRHIALALGARSG